MDHCRVKLTSVDNKLLSLKTVQSVLHKLVIRYTDDNIIIRNKRHAMHAEAMTFLFIGAYKIGIYL